MQITRDYPELLLFDNASHIQNSMLELQLGILSCIEASGLLGISSSMLYLSLDLAYPSWLSKIMR